MRHRLPTIFLLALLFLGGGCRGPVAGDASRAVAGDAPVGSTPTGREGAGSSQTPTAAPTRMGPPPSPTPRATVTPSPTPRPSATPQPTPTSTPLAACDERQPDDGSVLTLVSREFGLSRDYKPGDLVPLSATFSNRVTLGYPTEVRAAIIPPLAEMIAAMQAEELQPLVVSGFRDYTAQAMAEQKWKEQYPEWAHNLSAPAGHSEHQLGTTVDFSSPALPEMVGEEHIQFHPAFAQSPEGEWLAAHAHEYGFTLSYPANRFEETAFYYEPWHYRYVGVELATRLHEEALTISEYLLAEYGPPCIP